MNKSKAFLISSIIVATLMMIFAFGEPQVAEGGKEFVMVRVYEPVGANGEIVITYGGDKAERVDIEQLNSDHHEINGNKIVDVFNRLGAEGYSYESGSSAGSGNEASLVHVSTYVFSRSSK